MEEDSWKPGRMAPRIASRTQYNTRREHSARKEEDDKNKGASHVGPPLHRRPRHGGAPLGLPSPAVAHTTHHPAARATLTILYMPLLAPVLRAGWW